MKSRLVVFLFTGLLATSCSSAIGLGEAGPSLVTKDGESEPAILAMAAEVDSDCDGVPDRVDAYPRDPNDLGVFGWEASNGGYSGSDAPPIGQWPLSPYWWIEPVVNRCDLNANGILDVAELDPERIETDARDFAADVRAEQAAWETGEQELERLKAERQNELDQIAVQEHETCETAVDTYQTAVESAVAAAEDSGWTDAAYEVYDASLDAAEGELDVVLDSLTEIFGC